MRAKRTTTATGYANLVRDDHWSGVTAGGSGSGSEHDVTLVGISYIAFLLDHLDVPPDKAKALVLSKPAVLEWSAVEAEASSRWLRTRLKIDREEVGLLLLKLGTVGHIDIDGVLAPTVGWLLDNLAKTVKRVRLPDQRHERLPRYGDQQLWEEQLLGDFKTTHANTLYDVVRMLRGAPWILQRSVGEALEPKLNYVANRFNILPSPARRMVRDHLGILRMSEERIDGKLRTFRDLKPFGMEETDTLALVASAPIILSYKVETINDKLLWLQDYGGQSPEHIVKIIRNQPSILGLNPVENMGPNLAWLKEMFGDQATEILHKYPCILCASLDSMRRKPSYIGEALGLGDGETMKLLRRAPPLMTLCIDRNLRPKLDFFFTEMGASQEDVRAAVNSKPQILSYGLGRFQGRWATIRYTLEIPDPTFNKFWRVVCTWPKHQFVAYVDKCRW